MYYRLNIIHKKTKLNKVYSLPSLKKKKSNYYSPFLYYFFLSLI